MQGATTRSTWNDRLIKRLTKLWAEGLSAREIGNLIGVSKNAVIGKAHRLGLEPRRSPIKGAIKKGEQRSATAHRKLHNLARTPRSPTPYTGPNALEHLAVDQCRYTGSTTKPFVFCAKPIEVEGPYCGEHRDLCYVRQGKQPGEANTWKPWKSWL